MPWEVDVKQRRCTVFCSRSSGSVLSKRVQCGHRTKRGHEAIPLVRVASYIDLHYVVFTTLYKGTIISPQLRLTSQQLR